MNYHFDDPITILKGVGEASREKLTKLNIYTIGDLVRFLPTRYIDFSKQILIKELKNKKSASFLAEISNLKSFYTKSGKLLTQATATDSSGQVLLSWFNNPYIKRLIQDGTTYTIAGTPSFFGNKLTLISPVIEEGNSFSINTKGLVPIFHLTKGITSRWLRQKLFEVLNNFDLKEPLDDNHGFLDTKTAYQYIHFPKNKTQKKESDKRLSFNQHLSISITNLLKIKELGESPKIKISQKIHQDSLKKLPFTLTEDQEKTAQNLYKDLGSTKYSHRLIQGDTGSGKTATIILAANQCLQQNSSCALIAPTQILATQHFETFKKYLLFPEKIVLVLGGEGDSVPTDSAYIYIGTHALLTKLPKALIFPLAFLAIDEQHKFGVKQREELQNRTPIPHLINLSATPIPRTVALGLLGDIKLSNIKFKPQNRLPIKTFVTSTSYFKKSTDWLIEHLHQQNHVFVVCPNIRDQKTDTASVEKFTNHYKKILPPDIKVFSLHGQMKGDAQKQVMNQFKNTPGSVLVATSLIEVGIDVPTANIMIIHSAERFGLAQLHQLRGRVGRGETQSFCFLVPSTDDQTETERLELLQKYDSGLTLAKKDLILRGAGEVFGEKQHGVLQTRLKYFWSKKSFLKAKILATKLIDQNPIQAEVIAGRLSSC